MNSTPPRWRRVWERAGRSAALWSLTATALRVGNAVLLLPLTLRWLSAEEFGLWLSFLAVANFVFLADLGFSTIVARGAGYFWAGASTLSAFGVGTARPGEQGDPAAPNVDGLVRLARTVTGLYHAAALAAAVLLLAGGGPWFASLLGDAENRASALSAWVVFSVGTAIYFSGVGWSALLGGVGEVRRNYRILVLAQLAGYAASAAGILVGGGLWALVAGNFMSGAIQHASARAALRKKIGGGAIDAAAFDPSLARVLLPMSWRMGISNAAAFFTHQYNTLVCSERLGLSAAASFGLSQNCVFLLCQVAQTWWVIKLPEVNQLRVRQDQAGIAAVFSQRWLLFVATYALGATGLLLIGDPLLARIGARVRLIDAPALALLLGFWFLEYHASLFVLLKWSENENPFIWNILFAGAVMLVASPVLVPWLGYYGLIASLFVAQASFNHFVYIRVGMHSVGLGFWELARAIGRAPSGLWRNLSAS